MAGPLRCRAVVLLIAALVERPHAWQLRSSTAVMRHERPRAWHFARLPPPAMNKYEALEGGRPRTAARMSIADLADLIIKSDLPSSRVWLELTCGESLVLAFDREHGGCECMMRVQQTRIMAEECTLDDPAGCHVVGCVAVQWNTEMRTGVVLDLFKAKSGARAGCDISSADNRSIRWGALMLRVVDDIACLLNVRHVYLADESSIQVMVWDERTSGPAPQRIMLRYLRPLLHGVAYYEGFGYYTIPEQQWYHHASHKDPHPIGEDERAVGELNAFNALVDAPLWQLAGRLANLDRGPRDASFRRTTLIYRFCLAVSRAQENTDVEAAFCRAVEDDCSGERLPHQYWTHSLAALPYDPSLADFVSRHDGAIDGELLCASSFRGIITTLHRRNTKTDGEVLGEGALKAGLLMLTLLFDFHAIWSPQRVRPHKRKDFHDGKSFTSLRVDEQTCMRPIDRVPVGHRHSTETSHQRCSDDTLHSTTASANPLHIRLGAESHVPIIREAFLLHPEVDGVTMQGAAIAALLPTMKDTCPTDE